MKIAGAALLAGIAIGAAIAACARPNGDLRRMQLDKKHEITALWTQIRDWRREAGMDVEPPASMVLQMRGKSPEKIRRVCPTAPPPAGCDDVCSLADAICDNAESICGIAAELGGDPWADEKCDSAKASCREAKQRCCDCDAEPVP